MAILHYYQFTARCHKFNARKLRGYLGDKLGEFSSEICYNVSVKDSRLNADEER